MTKVSTRPRLYHFPPENMKKCMKNLLNFFRILV